MKPTLACAVLSGTIVLLGARQSVADAIRCGDQLASSGATLYEVRAVCGSPDEASQRIAQRTILQRIAGPCIMVQGKPVCGSVVTTVVDVVVDEWTYDFGSNRLLHHLRFENGKLFTVATGGYGKKPPA